MTGNKVTSRLIIIVISYMCDKLQVWEVITKNCHNLRYRTNILKENNLLSVGNCTLYTKCFY